MAPGPRPRPFAHAIAYGDSGGGKSTFAATWPKPMVVFFFDPFGKEMPYLKRGQSGDLETYEDGTPFRRVYSKKDAEREIIRIEHYVDPEPEQPEAYTRFRNRMRGFQHEYAEWKTAVVDSVTFMELAARKFSQYVTKKTSKEPRQWFADSTDAIEEMLMMRFGSLPMNVVVCAHMSEEKDELHGTFVRNPSAPGRMSKRMPAGYSELYRCYVGREANGEDFYALQTRGNTMYNSSSQVDAPDPCVPNYAALWENWT